MVSTTKRPTTDWSRRHLQMFTGASQRQNFAELSSIMPVRVVRRSSRPSPLKTGRPMALPEFYEFSGRALPIEAFLTDTETVGLLVLKNGEVVHEHYIDDQQASLQWPAWSITKSIASCLVGIATVEGQIRSLDDAVSDYAPELRAGGYDGVTVHQALAMLSGVRWNENYADPNSDIARHAAVMGGVGTRDELAKQSVREHPPGTCHRYNSSDTQVLGMVLSGATGKPLIELLRHQLWEPLGMEDDAFCLIDAGGGEWAAGGLQTTLRDLAKFGLLFANQGRVGSREVIPRSWIERSTRPAEPFLAPGPKPVSPGSFGYGYQWWLASDGSGAFAAIGVYNQYVFVDPARSIVIAKASANRRFASSYDEAGYRDEEHMAVFAKIAASL